MLRARGERRLPSLVALLAGLSVAACHDRGTHTRVQLRAYAPVQLRAPAPVTSKQAEPVFTGRGEVAPKVIAAHWLDRSWTVSELVDPGRGLVRYWTATGEIEPVPPDIQAHLCGAALSKALTKLDRSIAAAVRDAKRDEGVACTDRECTFSIANEYEPGRIALFDHRPGTPTALVAYLEVSRFTPDAEKAEARVRSWARAELPKPCPR